MAMQSVADGAVILAGGPSSRMGEPKALVEIDGEAMLLRVVKAVQNAGIPEVILSFKNQEHNSFKNQGQNSFKNQKHISFKNQGQNSFKNQEHNSFKNKAHT